MIALEDLKEKTQEQIIEHLSTQYAGKNRGFDYGEITEEDILEAKEKLKDLDVLVAYESVGSWGCDSNSFFLLQNRNTKQYYEVHGSHCSCYGFEGQLELEETTVKDLKMRIEKGESIFYTGGYDNNDKKNKIIVNEFIRNLAE